MMRLTLEVARLNTHEALLNSLAKSDRCFASNVLPQEMLFHALHRLLKIGLGQYFATYHVPEESSNHSET